VNAIWEGSGNVMALDVLRVLKREPEVAETVMDELRQASKGDRHLEAAHRRIEDILHEPRYLDSRARLLVEGLATLAAGTIMRAHMPTSLADAFIASRMGGLPRHTYGSGIDWADARAIISRASPNRT
jgi:putative acyl-CoA dehydrogenase